MSPYKKLFPAQEDSEKVFLLIRRHWFTYAIFWFLAIFMILPAALIVIYFLNNSADISPVLVNITILGGSIYLLSMIGILLYGFVDYYLDIYIVTNRRIVDIKQNGFFKREIAELNLRQVQDVNAKVNGIFPTLLHYGEVVVQTAGERENFVFYSVPHPYRISKTIIDLHEQYLSEKSSAYEEVINEDDLIGPKVDLKALDQSKKYLESTGWRETRSSDEKEYKVLEEEKARVIENLDQDKKNNQDVIIKNLDQENVLKEGEEKSI